MCIIHFVSTTSPNSRPGRKLNDSVSIADRIERKLVTAILRGEHVPGTHLPSIRAMATDFDTTVPTIQRVVSHLEGLGLVTPHRGSGLVVNDPRLSANLALAPAWFDALSDQPDELAQIFADFLELRRVVAVHLLKKSRDALANPTLLETVAALPHANTLSERIDLDLAFTAAFLDVTGQFAARIVFNTIERLVRRVPQIAHAFYADPDHHHQIVAATAEAILDPCGAEEYNRAMEEWDAVSVQRFRDAF